MGRDRWKLSKSQRMQLKALICVFGLLLVLLLLFGKLITLILHMDDDETPTPHVPVIEVLSNVWITEVSDSALSIYRDGVYEKYPFAELEETSEGEILRYQPGNAVREQVADVELTDGAVSLVVAKDKKIHGKVLSADSTGIEIEGYGRVPLAPDYKGYRLYDDLQMCGVGNLFIGYDFADFCLEDGAICGILMAKEAAMENIRVLVKTSDYGDLLHEEVVLSCDTDFQVIYGTPDNYQTVGFSAGSELAFGMDSEYFVAERVWIVPDVLTGKVILKNCGRNLGIPAYRGHIELLQREDGIAVINEVLLEEYLYSVVPSEMPSDYPKEALKAQAICARTYAYGKMGRAGYPQYGAHVDDSTSFQVYNNVNEQESTTTAVKETYGQLLLTEGGVTAGTYYYSTSCGMGSDSNVWKTAEAPTLTYLVPKPLNEVVMYSALTSDNWNAEGGAQAAETGNAEDEKNEISDESATDGMSLATQLMEEDKFAEFITSTNPDDFEVEEGWYRWTYSVEEIDYDRMLESLQTRYTVNDQLILTWEDGEYVSKEIKKLGEITDIYIEKRGPGGYADELIIETKSQKIKVISEYNIRCVLNDGVTKVLRQNDSKVNSPTLLPSGFFMIETDEKWGEVKSYTLIGGGYGHGVGMSQNGAKEMAKSGYAAQDILLYFYEGCYVENIYNQES